jgi:hypothetical protein
MIPGIKRQDLDSTLKKTASAGCVTVFEIWFCGPKHFKAVLYDW